MTAARRGRGRRSDSDAAQTRRTIIDVARRQFAERGFRGASVRKIASEAGIDPSLINHHFGDKAQLLLATMELPFDPLERIAGVLDGPLDDLAAPLIRTFCTSWDPHRDVFATLVRSSLDGAMKNPPMIELAQNVIIERITSRIDGDDAQLRAALIASQLIGLALTRYVARLEPVASSPINDVVNLYSPAMQHLITPDRSRRI